MCKMRGKLIHIQMWTDDVGHWQHIKRISIKVAEFQSEHYRYWIVVKMVFILAHRLAA